MHFEMICKSKQELFLPKLTTKYQQGLLNKHQMFNVEHGGKINLLLNLRITIDGDTITTT